MQAQTFAFKNDPVEVDPIEVQRWCRRTKEKEKAKSIFKGNKKGRDGGQRGKVGAKRTVKLLSQLWQEWPLGY